MNKKNLLIGIIILILFLVRYMNFIQEPVFFDELSTVRLAKLPFSKIIHQFHYGSREFGQMPLTFLLARFSMEFGTWSLFWLRLPFFIIALLGIIVFYFLLLNFVNTRFAVLGVLILVFLPSHLFQSHVARFYSIMFFSATCILFFLMKLLVSPTLKNSLCFSFFMIIGLYDHYFFGLFVVISWIILVMAILIPSFFSKTIFQSKTNNEEKTDKNLLIKTKSLSQNKYRKKISICLLSSVLVVNLAYLPWSNRFFEFVTIGGSEMNSNTLNGSKIQTKFSSPDLKVEHQRAKKKLIFKRLELPKNKYYLYDLRNPFEALLKTISYFSGSRTATIILLVLFILGFKDFTFQGRKTSILIFSFFAVTFIALALFVGQTKHMFHPRYVFFLLSVFLIGVVRGLNQVELIFLQLLEFIFKKEKVFVKIRYYSKSLVYIIVLILIILFIRTQVLHFRNDGGDANNNIRLEVEYHLKHHKL